MANDVFISYSSKNPDAAIAICHVLEEFGIKCWIAPRDIPAGKNYGDLIDGAIISCKVFLLVYSRDSLSSQWCNGELNVAFSERKIIVPYRIEHVPLSGSMRVILSQTHWIDSYPDYKEQFGALVKTIKDFIDVKREPISLSKYEKIDDFIDNSLSKFNRLIALNNYHDAYVHCLEGIRQSSSHADVLYYKAFELVQNSVFEVWKWKRFMKCGCLTIECHYGISVDWLLDRAIELNFNNVRLFRNKSLVVGKYPSWRWHSYSIKNIDNKVVIHCAQNLGAPINDVTKMMKLISIRLLDIAKSQRY